MHEEDEEKARNQLRMAVLGNWRDGIVAMGGLSLWVAW